MNFVRKNKYIIICYLIVIPLTCVYLASLDICFTGDSFEYISLQAVDYSLNHVDEMRTPGYVLLIDVFQAIFGENAAFSRPLVLFQICLSWGCIYFFYSAISRLVKRPFLAVLCTVLYCASPAIVAYDKVVLTESITLSLLSVYLYLIVRYIDSPKLPFGISAAAIAYIMTFIRPSSLVFLVLIFGFLIYYTIVEKDKKKRRTHIICSLACLILFALTGVYAMVFYNNFHTFSLSNTLLR